MNLTDAERREIEMDREFGGWSHRKDLCDVCKGYGFNIVFGCPTDCSRCSGTGRKCKR